MRPYYYITATMLVMLSVSLLACQQGQQGAQTPAPTLAPAAAPVPVPSETPANDCTAANGNCAKVPAQETPKPADAKPSITLPDASTLLATAGNAFSFSVLSQNTTGLTADCGGQKVAVFFNSEGHYTILISKMPDAKLSCSATATGNGGTLTVPFVITPQKASVLEKIVIKNVPDLVKIATGTTKVVSGIGIEGFSSAASAPKVLCNKNKATIEKEASGQYTLTIVNALPGDSVDICTLLVLGLDGHTTTENIGILSLYGQPKIGPKNFDATAALILTTQGNMASTDPELQSIFRAYVSLDTLTAPEIVIRDANGGYFTQFYDLKLSCTGEGFIAGQSQPFKLYPNEPDTVFRMNIQYNASPGGGEESCTVSAELSDPDDYVEPNIKFDFKLKWGN